MENEFKTLTCCICGIRFGLPAVMYRHLYDHGGNFHCPNGHGLHFGDFTVDRLNRKIESLQIELAQTRNNLSDQRRFIKEFQAKIERRRRRVNAGVCPHCNRSFIALARHIRIKHPQEPLPNQKQ